MKTVLGMVILVAGLTSIAAFAADPPLTAAGLGGFMSAVQFCEKVDPEHRDRYEDKAEQLKRGVDRKKIEEFERSSDYKSTHATISGVLEGIPKEDAIKLCVSSSK